MFSKLLRLVPQTLASCVITVPDSYALSLTTMPTGGDHQCHGVPGHRQAEAPQDGVRLLRVGRRGRVDAAGEQGGLLQDPVRAPSPSLSLCCFSL